MKHYSFKINGREYNIDILSADNSKAQVCVNGKQYDIEMNGEPGIAAKSSAVHRSSTPKSVSSATPAGKTESISVKAAPVTGAKTIKAPLPGVIISLNVTQGQSVRRGEKIAVLEAMKMENDILAPAEGTISRIYIQKGDSILEGAPIAEIE